MGLVCTHFSTVSGIVDHGNHSCAPDLAALARAVLREPRLARIVRRRSAVLPVPDQGRQALPLQQQPAAADRLPAARPASRPATPMPPAAAWSRPCGAGRSASASCCWTRRIPAAGAGCSTAASLDSAAVAADRSRISPPPVVSPSVLTTSTVASGGSASSAGNASRPARPAAPLSPAVMPSAASRRTASRGARRRRSRRTPRSRG